jgi:hypothetical protein
MSNAAIAMVTSTGRSNGAIASLTAMIRVPGLTRSVAGTALVGNERNVLEAQCRRVRLEGNPNARTGVG